MGWNKPESTGDTSSCSLGGYNGNEISLSGQGDVLVQVGDLSVRHNVLVADCLTQDCILGSDFLLLHGCVIDLHNHSLLVKGKVVPLSSGIYHSPICTCGVAVAETVEVPAHSRFRLIANRQGKKKEQGVDDLGSVMFMSRNCGHQCITRLRIVIKKF